MDLRLSSSSIDLEFFPDAIVQIKFDAACDSRLNLIYALLIRDVITIPEPLLPVGEALGVFRLQRFQYASFQTLALASDGEFQILLHSFLKALRLLTESALQRTLDLLGYLLLKANRASLVLRAQASLPILQPLPQLTLQPAAESRPNLQLTLGETLAQIVLDAVGLRHFLFG